MFNSHSFNRRTGPSRPALTALATVSLGLSALSGLAASNSLTNPSFELGLSGWTQYGSGQVNSTNDFTYCGVDCTSVNHVQVHEGTNTFKTWGSFWDSDNWNGCFQDVPASVDSVWSADCWALTHLDDQIGSSSFGANQFWLEVSFRNASAPNTSIVTYKSALIDPSTPPSTWVHLIVDDGTGNTNLVAPYGTSFVRCQMVFYQPRGYPGGSVYADEVTLLKTSGPDPEVTVHPVSQTRIYGQSVTFSVVAGGRSTLSYQWWKDGNQLNNGGRISGATTASLIINNLITDDQGSYMVYVTDNAGTAYSEMATLTVLDPGLLTLTPLLGQTKAAGQTATFTVQAAGSGSLTYQWQKDGITLVNGGKISGVTSPTLTVANLDLTNAGAYSLLVTGAGGSTNVSLGLKVVTPAEIATNLLVNSGFEDGLFSQPWESGWVSWAGGYVASTNDTYYNSTTPVVVREGTHAAQAYNGGTYSGFYQDVPASPGQVFSGSGWILTPTEDRLGAGNQCWLEVQFLTANNGMINLYKSAIFDSSSPAATWTYLQATNLIATWGDWSIAGTATSLVAPEGTVKVRVQLTYYAGGGSGGSVYADNMSLSVKRPVSITATTANGQFNLSFPTLAGASYQVLYKNDLGDANWQVLTTVTGDGSVKTVSDPLGTAKRFYRVNTL